MKSIFYWFKWLFTPTKSNDVWRIEKEAKRLVTLAQILTLINIICLIFRFLWIGKTKFEELLEQKGITAYRVSKDIGISPNCFSQWKHGRTTPKTNILLKIAEYFGVTIEYFVDKNA